ncbi:protein of unknown function [Methylocaldum szegediense]|uniref:Uncharacterized protein n=1 Tax=Methylocaldum szegediense TaxID=73780 RepID=A0ABM9I1M1_9GAMM|nr:protein of unknown function [Methylocaldum szegediense]
MTAQGFLPACGIPQLMFVEGDQILLANFVFYLGHTSTMKVVEHAARPTDGNTPPER